MRILGSLVSILISIITIVFIMKFLGVTWADFDHFIDHGVGGAVKILQMLKGTFSMDPNF